MFYPADRAALGSLVDRLLTRARRTCPDHAPVPKALIVPHAGYVYSGPVAASAYARLGPAAGRITRVVLLGPAHRVWFEGLADADANLFETPLGALHAATPELPGVTRSARAHADEHSLEVQLPFLQRVLGDVEVVPLLVGDASADAERALDVLRGFAVSKDAVRVGDVTATHAGLVTLRSRIGAIRVMDMLSGEQLPRIC